MAEQAAFWASNSAIHDNFHCDYSFSLMEFKDPQSLLVTLVSSRVVVHLLLSGKVLKGVENVQKAHFFLRPNIQTIVDKSS